MYNWAKYFERCNSVYFEGRAKRARDVYWAKYNGDSPDDPDNPDNPDDPVTKKYTIKYVLYDGENSDAKMCIRDRSTAISCGKRQKGFW